MKQDPILSMLGLAQKAGKIVSGEFMTEKAIQTGKACLVLVATDASDNTKSLFRNKCAFYEIPMYLYGNKGSLAAAIGKEFRACLAVTDPGFSNSLETKLNVMNLTE